MSAPEIRVSKSDGTHNRQMIDELKNKIERLSAQPPGFINYCNRSIRKNLCKRRQYPYMQKQERAES